MYHRLGGVFLKRIISIDRIEGDIIVAEAENCKMIDLAKEDFADEAKAGVCYYLGEDKKWHEDTAETERRKKKALDLLNSLIKKD